MEKQNREMKKLRYETVFSQERSLSPDQLKKQTDFIDKDTDRNYNKYIAEGITFLILIFIGALFVFRAIRSQFRMQYQQQNFMMAITHELKTPIAVAKLNLETLLKHHLDAEKQKKIIQMTLNETTRLNSLANNILVSAQLEGEGNGFTKDDLDFTSLVKDCVQEARNRYPERIFKEQIESEIEISGDPLLLQMMISNLIENAVKYSAKEKSISCLLKKNNDNVLLNILDEGIGIPDNEKKKIFDKFYRIGNESTRKTQGTGLGLYLCRKISKDHNADISVTNNVPAGSIFAITFHT